MDMNKKIGQIVILWIVGVLAELCYQAHSAEAEAKMAPKKLSFQKVSISQPWQNSMGMKFVPVPGTKVLFCIWETRVKDYAIYANKYSNVEGSWENPVWENIRVTPQDTCPVVCVSCDDAKAFCRWLTKLEQSLGLLESGYQYRLPTDAEWSVAVGLNNEGVGTASDKVEKVKGVYPWGTQWPPPYKAGNYDDYSEFKIQEFKDGHPRTAPVGSFRPNQFGIYDLGGNVWEWCEDWDKNEEKYCILRGASWLNSFQSLLLSSFRNLNTAALRSPSVGFRVVLEAFQ